MLEDDSARTYLILPIRMRNDGRVEILLNAQKNKWMPLVEYRKMSRRTYGYFLSLLDLSAELCLGRNSKSLAFLQEVYQFDSVKHIIKSPELPFEMRALFMRILLHIHMDREPLEPIQIPSQTGVWKELPPFIKDHYASGSNFIYPIKQSKISVPTSLTAIKKFVEHYLYETKGVQNIYETGKNMMTLEILKIIQFMLNHGFYKNLEELKEVALPMIKLLNGSNDIYYNVEEDHCDGSFQDFVNVKRYLQNGSNDIIVLCKAIICENLLIISQLEIDGKAQVFLSKFKSDIDMLILQRTMKLANQTSSN
jgi:hypothetical protein